MTRLQRCLCGLMLSLVWAPSVGAQPGCRTVVLPERVINPGIQNSEIIVPPGLSYPFHYTTPGITSGVETLYIRVNPAPWGAGVALWNGTAQWTAWTQPLHVIPYQVLPYPIGTTVPEPYFRKQGHLLVLPTEPTTWSAFENFSVVLQGPREGLVGEQWNVGIWNPHQTAVAMELQVFVRECR